MITRYLEALILAQFECWDITPTTADIEKWAADGEFVDNLLRTAADGGFNIEFEPDEVAPVMPTWGRIDLTKYLDGSYTPPLPEFFERSDGVALFYRGKTHSLHGESESGKSLLVQIECGRVLRAGGRVLYIDFEDSPDSVVGRLMAFGATPEEIAERFDYRRPEVKPTGEIELPAFNDLLAQSFDFAVLDGVTEAMVVLGNDVTDVNERFAAWANAYPKLIAVRTGAAVVVVDHVTKNVDGRGRFAIGPQAKMATITGASYSVDVLQPIGRGMKGAVSIRLGKDRAGNLRSKCGEYRTADRSQEAAHVIIDSTGKNSIVEVRPPSTSDPDPVRRAMSTISIVLAEGPLNLSDLRKVAGAKVEVVTKAVSQLVERGHVQTYKGSKNATMHALLKPYRLHEDPDSPLFYPLDVDDSDDFEVTP